MTARTGHKRQKSPLFYVLRLLKQVSNVIVLLTQKKRPCGLVVTIYAPTKRRLDPPNFYPTVKALVDGLTDAGIWTDDNSEVIKFMTFKRGELSGIVGKYKIEMEIKGYDEEICST